jgi:hypothetical protein
MMRFQSKRGWTVNVFAVLAHPEPRSFNGAMHRTAVQTLRAARQRRSPVQRSRKRSRFEYSWTHIREGAPRCVGSLAPRDIRGAAAAAAYPRRHRGSGQSSVRNRTDSRPPPIGHDSTRRPRDAAVQGAYSLNPGHWRRLCGFALTGEATPDYTLLILRPCPDVLSDS